MLMFDSLNRHMLSPYGCTWTKTPNFTRLAERAVTFENSYIGSMPCMPCRRDFHTGRLNFLHRSWGPLEPFDESMPLTLQNNGVHSHLATDHYHYFEEGGCTYHTKYKTWEFFRGQEGDPWIGMVNPPPAGNAIGRNANDGPFHLQDRINRLHMRREEDQPQSKTIDAGLEFIRRNRDGDRWFLHIETFDPHEPFFSQRKYKDIYPEHFLEYFRKNGPVNDWPPYQRVTEPREQVEHMRYEYAALLSMCDSKLGEVLDVMDELRMWEDTMLVVWTDHGFLLGEKDYWAKVWLPYYNEIAHTPLFVWDPRNPRRGERRKSIVQPAIDLPVTALEFFGIGAMPNTTGRSLTPVIRDDTPSRRYALFGSFGAQMNITDGRYVFMLNPARKDNGPLFQYTMMPTHMRQPFSADQLRLTSLGGPFRFTRDCAVMKVPAHMGLGFVGRSENLFQTMLFDLQSDPDQLKPIRDEAVESRLIEAMVKLMREHDAPAEQYERLGISALA